jgi:hypothetical protein
MQPSNGGKLQASANSDRVVPIFLNRGMQFADVQRNKIVTEWPRRVNNGPERSPMRLPLSPRKQPSCNVSYVPEVPMTTDWVIYALRKLLGRAVTKPSSREHATQLSS